MHRDSEHIPELVSAARAGDGSARERLVADYLPLVYNVVGRALGGHADVDDVVQDTMFRALDGLGGLREPSRFRSWLVAIAMNQIRRRWTDRQQAPVASLERVAEQPDPAADFVELTILRLGLSGQRREVAEATRWLDADDRGLLALWWQEAAGELARTELAEALGVSTRHAAVRVQRMKTQLETGRVVVRALTAAPRCRELARVTEDWDGRPAPVWRKRIARHARACRACGAHWSDLVPAEALLAGLALVVPLSGYPAVGGSTALAGATTGIAGAGHSGQGTMTDEAQAAQAAQAVSGGMSSLWQRYLGVGGAVVGVLVLVALWPGGAGPSVPDAPSRRTPEAAGPPSPTASPAEAATRTPFEGAGPGPRPVRTAPPSTSPTPSPTRHRPPAPSVEQRLTSLVNARRAEAGCGPLRLDARLSAAARAHARDMVARGYFEHASPEGRHADARIADAGYDVGPWAENLHRGPREAATVVEDWMDGSIHQENMLGCQYRDTGFAAVPGPEGTVWVQTLAGPS